MAAPAKTASSSTVSSSDRSMSTVFSSCRILDVEDIEEGVSGNGAGSVFQYPSMSTGRVASHVRYYYIAGSQDGHRSHRICDTCYLCKGNIRNNRDVYIYRGELPFCSPECRMEQIEMDTALERLQQAQLQNRKGNSVPTGQNECSMESGSYIDSRFGYLGYNVVRYIISLVVG